MERGWWRVETCDCRLLVVDLPLSPLLSPLSLSSLLNPCGQPADRKIAAGRRFDYIRARPLENDPVAGIVRDVQQAGGQGVPAAQQDMRVGRRCGLGIGPLAIDHAGHAADNDHIGFGLEVLRRGRRADVGRLLAVDARIRNSIHPADHQSERHDHRGHQVGERETAHRGVKRRDGGIQWRRSLDDDRGGGHGVRCVVVQRRRLAGACPLPLAKMQTQVEVVEIELPRGRLGAEPLLKPPVLRGRDDAVAQRLEQFEQFFSVRGHVCCFVSCRCMAASMHSNSVRRMWFSRL